MNCKSSDNKHYRLRDIEIERAQDDAIKRTNYNYLKLYDNNFGKFTDAINQIRDNTDTNITKKVIVESNNINMTGDDVLLEEFLTIDESRQRKDAMIQCTGLGDQFMKHFHKIYTSPNNTAVNHWFSEMASWFEYANNITMRGSKRHIDDDDFYQWFLVYDSTFSTIIPEANEEERIAYYKFAEFALRHRNDFRTAGKEYLCKLLNIKF